MKHGIEIFVENKWTFVEAPTRESADLLQARSQTVIPSRRVAVTAEGHYIRLHATE